MPLNVSRNIIKDFIQRYDIGTLSSYRRITKGFANTVVDIKTSRNRFILKIAQRNNPVRVQYEVDLLRFVQDLPTPQPIAARDGSVLQNYSSTHKAFVYPRLKGRERKNFSASMLRQVGAFLGDLHNQTAHFSSSIPRLELYHITPRSLEPILQVCRRTNEAPLFRAADYIQGQLPQYYLPASLPQGAMHIDLKPENCLFSRSRLTGVVDFDNAYQGPLLLDLANTLMWFCSKRGTFNMQSARMIHQAYEKKRALSAEERGWYLKALHYAFLTHVLIDIQYYIQKKLPKSYVYEGIRILLAAQQALTFSSKDFLSQLENNGTKKS